MADSQETIVKDRFTLFEHLISNQGTPHTF